MSRRIRPNGKTGYTVIDNRTGKTVAEIGPWERNEFWVVFLKDRHARAALVAYATDAAAAGDREYAGEVMQLADRAGPSSPFCKAPD